MKKILLAVMLLPMGTGILGATDEMIAVNHCAPGRSGLICNELLLDSGAATAHLKNHANDSLVEPPADDGGIGVAVIDSGI